MKSFEMDSVGIDGVDESQPIYSISNKCESSSKIRDESSVFDGASVPKKLRSDFDFIVHEAAVKKHGRESISPPSPILEKDQHVSSGKEMLREPNMKKSKPNKRQKHNTKDEEEVAETLFSLAGMFSGETKNDNPRLEVELSEAKTSCIIKAGRSMTETEDSPILTPQLQSLFNQETSPDISTLQLDMSLGARQKMSLIPETRVNIEWETSQGQIVASGIHHGNNCKSDEKNYGLSLLPPGSSTGASSSGKQGSSRLPPWFANTSSTTPLTRAGPTADSRPKVTVESKKQRKANSTHVHICRLIKVSQLSSEKKERIRENSGLFTTNGDLETSLHLSINNQKTQVNGGNDFLTFNGILHSAVDHYPNEVQNAILLHKRLVRDQHQASNASVACSSVKQGSSNFLSLAGGEHDLNAGEGRKGKGQSYEAIKRPLPPFPLPPDEFPVLSSLLQNPFSSSSNDRVSAVPTQQVRFPPFLQAEGTSRLPFQYNSGGGVRGGIGIQDWMTRTDSSFFSSCFQAVFPNLHSVLFPKHEQRQFMDMNSSSSSASSLPLPNVKRQNYLHRLPMKEKWFLDAHHGNQ